MTNELLGTMKTATWSQSAFGRMTTRSAYSIKAMSSLRERLLVPRYLDLPH